MLFCLNNCRFGYYLHLIYPNELEGKDTTDIQNLLLTWPSPWNRQRRMTKTEPTTNMMLHFFMSTSLLSLAFYFCSTGVWSLHFTFHTLFYGLCPEQWSSGQSYSNKAMSKSSLQKNIRSPSQSGWPLRNIHISNDNESFASFVDVFFPLSLPILLPDLMIFMYMVFLGVRVPNLVSCLCCPLMCLYVLSSVLWYPLRFPHKSDVLSVFI